MRRAAIAAIAAIAALFVACEDGGRGSPPPWSEATLASCWDGPNAEIRMMNILSPTMPEATFKERVRWMEERGCNTAHVFLCNRENGDHARYSPWGVGVGPSAAPCDGETARLMRHRIGVLRDAGLAVVAWIMSDDSAPWARDLAANAGACLRRIKEAGLIDEASAVVAGLEMDEYWGASDAARVVAAIRSVYGGAVGTHHTGGRADFAGLADILFYQTSEPGLPPARVAAEVSRALAHGRPVAAIEIDRHPNRAACEAALGAGAFAVGNW